MIRSTFGGFSMALSGLNASQKSLDVTGQNITNMNTRGYTRQRLDLYSIKGPGHGQYSYISETKVGQGVMMQSVSQLRDPYLDFQFRAQLAKVGTQDAQSEILGQIGNIFDKVDTSNVQEALDEIVSQLQDLSTKVGQDGSDSLVREAFSVLVDYLHQNATELENIRSTLLEKMQTTIGPEVNEILQNISKLNESIKSAEVLGDPALELRDQRNLLIDDLATYLPIEVTTKHTDVGAGRKVEELQIKIKGSDKYLVSDDVAGELTFTENPPDSGELKLEIRECDIDGNLDGAPGTDYTKKLTEGIIKGNLDMLNSDGYSAGETEVKGIGYYEALLNSYANTLATEMNKLNAGGDPGDGPLFEGADANGYFTASDIKISDGWKKGTVNIKNTVDGGASTANDNILRMKDLLSTRKDLVFKTTDGMVLYEGSMPGAYTNIQNMQGIQMKSTQSMLNNRISIMNDIYDNRDSISGVSLDEEVANLMRFQQSYNAAARVMTVMDEALDILINRTGIVGR